MSEFLIRNLAAAAAAHPKIESAVLGALRETLPGVINDLLREGFAGETLRLYVPKNRGRSDRRERDNLIRSRFTGNNHAALAGEFGVTVRHIRNIVSPGKSLA